MDDICPMDVEFSMECGASSTSTNIASNVQHQQESLTAPKSTRLRKKCMLCDKPKQNKRAKRQLHTGQTKKLTDNGKNTSQVVLYATGSESSACILCDTPIGDIFIVCHKGHVICPQCDFINSTEHGGMCFICEQESAMK